VSTSSDVCPFCLRYEGLSAAREAGTRFCPQCGTDWQVLDGETSAEEKWREDSVVLPVPAPPGQAAESWGERETGPVPALSEPGVRSAARPLQLTPPPTAKEAWDTEVAASADVRPPVPLTIHDRPTRPPMLPAEPTDPVPRAPPGNSPWVLIGGAGTVVALAVVALFASSSGDPAPALAPPPVASAPPSLAPSAAASEVPALPPLPSPARDPERRSAAVKEHIELALRDQPDSVEAEIGVRVDDGVAFLIGTVDSATTRELVSAAAGQTFGIKAVDAREVKLERRAPPVHVVEPGETLSAVARRLYGSSGKWRRIYEVNPGIDPNLIRIGQPLTLPDAPTRP